MAYIAQNLKSMNRRTVYNLLLEKEVMSRAEISRQTGISAPTVIKIIEYFKDNGLVEELGGGESALGRKPQMLRFCPHARYSIGIEFAGVDLKGGIVDLAGNVCHSFSTPVVPMFETVLRDELCKHVETMIAQSGIDRAKISGICIGVPAVVNKKEETIDLAPLVGITELTQYTAIVSELSRRLKMPVTLENDANVSAIGEFIHRRLCADDDLLYIILGKGIGAGIILGGALRQGSGYSAGEIGYMAFDKHFTADKHHAGWLEQQLDLDALRSSESVVGDERLDELAGNLALAILNICLPLEIRRVVFGRFKDADFDAALVKRINRYLHSLSVLDLVCHQPLCDQPGIVGCASIVAEPMLEKLLAN